MSNHHCFLFLKPPSYSVVPPLEILMLRVDFAVEASYLSMATVKINGIKRYDVDGVLPMPFPSPQLSIHSLSFNLRNRSRPSLLNVLTSRTLVHRTYSQRGVGGDAVTYSANISTDFPIYEPSWVCLSVCRSNNLLLLTLFSTL